MKINAIVTLAIRDEKSFLEIKDGLSRIVFFESVIENSEMLQILSGQAGIHVEADVFDLESVGKKKETIRYSFEISDDDRKAYYKNSRHLDKMMENHTPAGYTTNYYLGSKDNFDGNIVHQTAYRYVDVDKNESEGKNDE